MTEPRAPEPAPTTIRRRSAPDLRKPLGFLVIILICIILGKAGWLGDINALQNWLEALDTGPRGALTLIAIFCLGAFLGIPQFVLIGAGVVVFGPVLGFLYSWVAVCISGTLTFLTGRIVGAEAVARRGGARVKKLAGFLGQNTFLASAMVRSVPAGPFILVNMVFGASGARLLPFLFGLAGGALPKLALVAFAGESLRGALTGSVWRAGLFGLVTVLVWLGLGLVARRAIRRGEEKSSTTPVK